MRRKRAQSLLRYITHGEMKEEGENFYFILQGDLEKGGGGEVRGQFQNNLPRACGVYAYVRNIPMLLNHNSSKEIFILQKEKPKKPYIKNTEHSSHQRCLSAGSEKAMPMFQGKRRTGRAGL